MRVWTTLHVVGFRVAVAHNLLRLIAKNQGPSSRMADTDTEVAHPPGWRGAVHNFNEYMTESPVRQACVHLYANMRILDTGVRLSQHVFCQQSLQIIILRALASSSPHYYASAYNMLRRCSRGTFVQAPQSTKSCIIPLSSLLHCRLVASSRSGSATRHSCRSFAPASWHFLLSATLSVSPHRFVCILAVYVLLASE